MVSTHIEYRIFQSVFADEITVVLLEGVENGFRVRAQHQVARMDDERHIHWQAVDLRDHFLHDRRLADVRVRYMVEHEILLLRLRRKTEFMDDAFAAMHPEGRRRLMLAWTHDPQQRLLRAAFQFEPAVRIRLDNVVAVADNDVGHSGLACVIFAIAVRVQKHTPFEHGGDRTMHACDQYQQP